MVANAAPDRVARVRSMTSHAVRSAPPLPGGVGISRLRVYDWEGPDGLRGGSPHVHLVCSEAYLVLDGEGAVQTLRPGRVQRDTGPARLAAVVDAGADPPADQLRGPRDHRAHADRHAARQGPGDCILTFPEDVLRDRQAYLDARRARSRPLRRGCRRRRGEARARPSGRGLQPAARALDWSRLKIPLLRACRGPVGAARAGLARGLGDRLGGGRLPRGRADRLARGRRRAVAGRRDVRDRSARERGPRALRAAPRLPVGRRPTRDLTLRRRPRTCWPPCRAAPGCGRPTAATGRRAASGG